MDMGKPTGKIRYRVLTRLFKPPVLILQVECTGYPGYPAPPNGIGKWWRDADVRDFTEQPMGRVFEVIDS